MTPEEIELLKELDNKACAAQELLVKKEEEELSISNPGLRDAIDSLETDLRYTIYDLRRVIHEATQTPSNR